MIRIRGGIGITLLSMGLVVFGGAAVVRAATDWYVSPVGSDSTHNGTNGWDDAFQTISNAIARSAGGDRIRLTNGIHSINAELIVGKGVTIVGNGGWAGTTVQRNLAAANFRVFRVTHADAVLSGLTIQNGNRHASTGLSGCGVYLDGGTITNCYVTANWGGNRDIKSRGAGVYVNKGLLVDSVVHANGSSAAIGGGVYVVAGLVDRCTISQNQAGDAYGPSGDKKAGAGVYLTGGTLRSSVIRNNSSTCWAGGGIYLDGSGARVENCTIVANTVASSTGGGVQRDSGTVVNSIIWNNTATGLANDYHGALSAITYSSAPELATGTGNLTDAPRFVNAGDNDYRQRFDSPGVDAGSNLATVTNDRNGVARPTDSLGSGTAQHDMGAYEHAGPASESALTCAFRAAPSRFGLNTLADVVFTAYVAGPPSETAIANYAWALGPHLAAGADQQTTTHSFGLGGHTVSLAVTNTLGNGVTVVFPSYIQAIGSVVHVSASGANRAPFASWSDAAASVNEAADMALRAAALGASSETVLVSNSTYNLTRQLLLDAPVTVRGQGAREGVIIRSPIQGVRCAYLAHAGARLEGVTLKDADMGVKGADGAGVWMSNGIVTNCYITNCRGGGQDDKTLGGGVYISGGLLVGSTLHRNRYSWTVGGGVYVAGGLVDRCVISENLSGDIHGYPRAGGAGAYMTAGTIRNSLILRNETSRRGGGGVQMVGSSALLESCTVVSNKIPYYASEPEYGAGVRVKASVEPGANSDPAPGASLGTVRNCVIWGNLRASVTNDVYAHTSAVTYTLAGNLTDALGVVWGTGNLVTPPQFVNVAANDFRLTTRSPGVEAGSTQGWMTNAGAIDLGGNPRVLNKRVDLGAYEILVPPVGTVMFVR